MELKHQSILAREKIHYVYLIKDKETKLLYIGVRGAETDDLISDLKRYGTSSGMRNTIIMDPTRFLYRILKTFKDRKAADLYESFLHKKYNVRDNPRFWNRANCPEPGFSSAGFTTVLDMKTMRTKSISTEEYHSNKDRYKTPGTKEFIDFKKRKDPTYEYPNTNKNPVLYDKKTNAKFKGPKELVDGVRYTIFATKETEDYIRENFDPKYKRKSTKEQKQGTLPAYDKILNKNVVITTEEYISGKGSRYLNWASRECRELHNLGPPRKYITAYSIEKNKFVSVNPEEYYKNKKKFCNANSSEFKNVYREKYERSKNDK